MERICKNCKHFDPVTSICDWHNPSIKLESDWCYSFYPKEKENKKMTISDIEDQLSLFTDYELGKIIETVAKERNKRALAKREELTKAFFKAWNDLENEGIEIYFKNEPLYLEDLDFE